MSAELSQSPSRLSAGTSIGGRYEIEQIIGEGAQGVVYLARRRDGGKIALKVLHRHLCGDPLIFKRFHREASILKRLEGEHLVKLLDFIEEDGQLMIALEYVEGTSLEGLLTEKAPLEIKKALEIALQVCAALGCAHAAGVVHRDLKPANVLIETSSFRSPEGDGRVARESGPESVSLRVRVVDFGLAKVVHGEHMTTGLTEQDMIFGTPEYMAPEQARGDEADARSDLYAAGVMLYEMTVGKVPFSGRTPLAAMTAHLTQDVPPPRSGRRDHPISAELESVILRALAKSPEDRYASARAFAEALASVRDETKVVKSHPVSSAPVVIAPSDTDLNLIGAAEFASMKTLPVDSSVRMPADIEAAIRSRARTSGRAPALDDSPTRPAKQATDPPPRTKRSQPDGSETTGAGDDSLEIPRSPMRWLWAVVAVVFALVGVVIGALIGAR